MIIEILPEECNFYSEFICVFLKYHKLLKDSWHNQIKKSNGNVRHKLEKEVSCGAGLVTVTFLRKKKNQLKFTSL